MTADGDVEEKEPDDPELSMTSDEVLYNATRTSL
jgi:hypothetical protein